MSLLATKKFREGPAARVVSHKQRLFETEPHRDERLDELAKNTAQRGEFIRQLILDELARESGDPTVSAELRRLWVSD